MVFGREIEANEGWGEISKEEFEKLMSEPEEQDNGGMDDHYWDGYYDPEDCWQDDEDDDDEWENDDDWEINDRE